MHCLIFFVQAALGATCTGYEGPQEVAAVAKSPINEASGLAASRTRAGVWFTHNDAGGAAEIYAFDLQGNYLETHQVLKADFRDWEDMSAAPCPDADGDCLYIGDVGDNGRSRDDVAVYCVREPQPGEPAEVLASWKGTYPKLPMDSETVFVHPRSGRIYLATKDIEAGSSEIYRFAEQPGDKPLPLEHVHTWKITGGGNNTATTGGDWDRDGDRLVIRTYADVYEWSTDPCDPDAHWGETPTAWLVGDQHGEAIAYDEQGDLLAVTEGDPMVITRLACQKAGPGSEPCDTGEPPDTGTPHDSDASGSEPPSGDSSPADSGDPPPGDSPSDSASAEGDGDEGCGCGGCSHSGGVGLLGLLAILGLARRRSLD